MSNVTIAVGTAKNVFKVAISAAAETIRERHLASWLGLTPREAPPAASAGGSAGSPGRATRTCTLLIHGARSALLVAERARRAGRKLTHLQAWALKRAGEGHTNRAAVALANKLARIAWAVWRHERSFDGHHALHLAA
jgi:transposase